MTVPAQGYLDPLVQESTPSIIAEKLRAAIGHGEIAPGSQLFEAELARRLGVSRGPLREGLQRLTQEGLLVAVRNRGVFVVQMTPEAICDMYQARSAVERAAAQQIFGHDPGAAAQALLAIIDRMAAMATAALRSEADLDFHFELVSRSASPRLQRMHKTLLTETRMCLHALEDTYAEDSYAMSDDRVAEHRAIAAAIGAGERELTDRLMVDHMNEALARLVGRAPIS